MNKSECRLKIVETVDLVVNEIDLLTERLLISEADEPALCSLVNDRRGKMIQLAQQIQKTALFNLETITGDHDLMSRVFKPFCFVLEYGKLPFLIITPSYNTPEQIQQINTCLKGQDATQNEKLSLMNHYLNIDIKTEDVEYNIDFKLESTSNQIDFNGPVIYLDSLPQLDYIKFDCGEFIFFDKRDAEMVQPVPCFRISSCINMLQQFLQTDISTDRLVIDGSRLDHPTDLDLLIKENKFQMKWNKLSIVECFISHDLHSFGRFSNLETLEVKGLDPLLLLEVLESVRLLKLLRRLRLSMRRPIKYWKGIQLSRQVMMHCGQLDELAIVQAHIGQIDADTFIDFGNLKRLELSILLDSDANKFLEPLKSSLTCLVIWYSSVKTLSYKLCENMPELVELEIQSGNIGNLELDDSSQRLFRGINQLQILDLSHIGLVWNPIRVEYLYHLPKLNTLKVKADVLLYDSPINPNFSLKSLKLVVTHNLNLKLLGFLNGLESLEIQQYTYGQITDRLETSLFKSISNLKSLKLDANITLEPGCLEIFSKLENLYLSISGLEFESCDKQIFSGLVSLKLLEMKRVSEAPKNSFEFFSHLGRFVLVRKIE